MTRGHLAQLLVATLLVAVAGLAFDPVYATRWLPVLLLAAAALSTGLRVLAITRLPGKEWLSLLISLGAYVLFTAATVFRDSAFLVLPSPASLGDLVDGLINGWARLMTTEIPIGDDPSVLLVAPTLVWIAGYLTAGLALRRRAVLAPLLPAVVLLAIGVFASGTETGAGLGTVALFAGLALVLLLLRTLRPAHTLANVAVRSRQSVGGRLVVQVEDEAPADTPEAASSRRRQAVLGVGVLVVVMLVAPLLGPRLPFSSAREPVDPRELNELPPELEDGVSPLVFIRSLRGDEERSQQPMFSVRPDGQPDYWRLAVLDEFDGTLWTSSGEYQPIGTEVPPDEDLDVPTQPLEQEIEITGLSGSWLPAADRPSTISGLGDTRVMADTETGVLLADTGGLEGLTYEVISDQPVISTAAKEFAVAASGPEADALLELPPADGELANERRLSIVQRAQEVVAGLPDRSFARAFAIQEYLRDNVTPLTAPLSGHGYGNVYDLLTSQGGQPGSAGPEQLASTFALMARAVDLPARVVVGFRSGAPDADGRYQVLAGDAWAWPEVWFAGLGWVPFEPTQTSSDEGAEELEELLEAQQRATDDLAQELTGGTDDGRLAGDEGSDDTRNVLVAAITLVVVAVLALIAGLVTISVLRRRRRRRRSVGTPRQRVVGAYREALDGLNEAGLRGTRAMTAAELAAHTQATFGEEAVRHLQPLGDMANQALFSEREPLPRQADEAWVHVTRLESTLVSQRSTGDRIRRRVDPRLLARSR